jgi:two-component system OmpR family response regulator
MERVANRFLTSDTVNHGGVQHDDDHSGVMSSDGGLAQRVLVLVDDAVVRRRVCSRLGAHGLLVLGDSPGGDPAVIVTEMGPDVVLMSVHRDPLVAIEQLGEVTGVGLIALVSGGPLARAAALAAGFDDVGSLEDDPVEIAARVDAALVRARRRGRLVVDDVVIDLDQHVVWRAGEPIGLTATEFRLLATFARHPRHVLTKRQLLATVWGYDDYDVNVVEGQVSALRRKLEAAGPRLVHTVRGVGYVLRPGTLDQGRVSTSTATP